MSATTASRCARASSSSRRRTWSSHARGTAGEDALVHAQVVLHHAVAAEALGAARADGCAVEAFYNAYRVDSRGDVVNDEAGAPVLDHLGKIGRAACRDSV